MSLTQRKGSSSRARWLSAAGVIVLGLAMGATPAASDPLDDIPQRLVVERLENPMEVNDLDAPRFSWQNRPSTAQDAYQIRVAKHDNPENDANVWDSGKVEDSQSTDVAFGGPRLKAETRYWWTVRIQDSGTWSPWSEPATFGTLANEDWDAAETIWTPKPEQWGDDLTIEFKAQFIQKHVSLAFRAQDPGNLYLWQIRGDGANELATHVIKDYDSSPTELDVVPIEVEIQNGEDAPFYDVKVEIRGDRIATYFEGELIDETTDSSFSSGGFGFRTGRTESFAVKDVKAYSPSGEEIYESSFGSSNEFGCGEAAGEALIVPAGHNEGCIYYGPWGDYDWEADVTVDAVATGIVFRARDQNNYYMWQIRGDNSTVVPHVKRNGEFTALAPSEKTTPERSEEHTSELQSRGHLVCRLL